MWSIHMCNLLHNNIRMNTLTFQLEVLSELLVFLIIIIYYYLIMTHTDQSKSSIQEHCGVKGHISVSGVYRYVCKKKK